MRVLICASQPPFVDSCATRLRSLEAALKDAGHPTAVITMPLLSTSAPALLRSMTAWRLQHLDEIDGLAVDRVIALEFPGYLARHPAKVLWLQGLYRPAYEHRAQPPPQSEQAVAELVRRADARLLGESRHIFATSRGVAETLRRVHAVEAETLYSPPERPGDVRLQYGDYVLFHGSPAQSSNIKVLLKIFAGVRSGTGLVITGTKPQDESLDRRIVELGLGARVRIADTARGRKLVALYAGALAVFSGATDCDSAAIALQAFACRKPFIVMAGGAPEFIESEVNGLVVALDELAATIERLASDRSYAKRLGEAGKATLDMLDLTWPRIAAKLLE